MAKDKKPKTKTGVKPKLVKVIVKDGDTKPASDKNPLTIIVLALIASVSLPVYFLSPSFEKPVKDYILPPITQTYEVPKTPAITVQPTIVVTPSKELEPLKPIIEPTIIKETKSDIAEIKSQEVFGPTIEEFTYGVEIGKESPVLLQEYLKPTTKVKKKKKSVTLKSKPSMVVERPKPVIRPKPIKVERPIIKVVKKKVSLKELIENNDSLREKCAQRFDGTPASRIERNLLNCPVND